MKNHDPVDELLSATVKEACRLTGFSKDAIYELINDGSIRSFLMGNRRFIDAASLRAYIARRANEPLRLSDRAPTRQRGARREANHDLDC